MTTMEGVPTAGHLPATLQQLIKDFLVQLPGAMPVGVRQRGTARGLDAQMGQLALATGQTAADFPQAMSPA
jgi:hypothetical protein